MATLRTIVLPYQEKQDGTWNVKIRVSHNRKNRYIPTPFFVKKSQLTKSFAIKDVALKDILEERLRELRDKIIKLGFMVNTMEVDALVDYLTAKNEEVDFFAFASDYIDQLYAKQKDGTAKIYFHAVNSVRAFWGDHPLFLSQLDASFIAKYFRTIQHLKPNTINSYVSCLKRLHKLAMLQYNDLDNGVLIVKPNIFRLIELPKSEEERKSLTVEQMQAIIDTPYTGYFSYDMAKDLFILSFVCFGINPYDLIFAKKSQVKNGIFTYFRQKVKNKLGKHAEMQIKLCDVAKKIISKYNGDKTYLLDFGPHKRAISVCRFIHGTFVQAGLEEDKDGKLKSGVVKGEYVFYTARHTMATLARNECNIDYMTVHEMLNHAMPTNLRTTDTYIKRDYRRLWEANEKLLALFDWSFYLKQ